MRKSFNHFFLIFLFYLLLWMTNYNEANERTRKASKLIVDKIKQLINEKVERYFLKVHHHQVN
ncbi:unnamed protein product [Meloidogyne enterolobii]|uniref:Uncharacterized protein n=1 Tax=Meloidogyne enterolobii TaxID=390850 RepID=A0ACB1AE46_MELEN